jgi:hypothetical protein
MATEEERFVDADPGAVWELLSDIVLGIQWSGPLAGVVRRLVGPKAGRMVAQEADAFVRLAEAAGHAG